MKIKTVVVGSYRANCYILIDDSDPQNLVGALVDPGEEPDKIITHLKNSDVKIEKILITHGHFDHVGAASELKEFTKAPIYANTLDEEHYEGFCVPDFELLDRGTIQIGKLKARIIHTPGHSQGGVCIYFEAQKILFSGDTLFSGSIGRTDMKGSSYKQIIESIQTRLMNLPDEIKVYPGHGFATTIGEERRNNPFLQG